MCIAPAAAAAGRDQQGAQCDGSLEAALFDWDDGEVAARSFAAEYGPFDTILGAALQFETWEDQLWPVLTALADGGREHGGAGTVTTVALATTAGALSAPERAQHGWALEQRVSGDAFGMVDLRGGQSEFEVMVADRTR